MKKDLVLTRSIRNLKGDSHPLLAEASDGLAYVVKFRDSPRGPNRLFNESMGTELYRACGLTVPSWKQLLVTDEFLNRNPDCWKGRQGNGIRPEAGWCFGSQFLGAEDGQLLEILPETSFWRIRKPENFWLSWLIDVCAWQTENRQVVFRGGTGVCLDPYFVDHDHLFGGGNGECRPGLIDSRYLDARIYGEVSSEQLSTIPGSLRALQAERLWGRIRELPEDWKTESALAAFSQCIDRLTDIELLQNILHEIVDIQRRSSAHEQREHSDQRKPPSAVLYHGVPAKRVGAC